MAPGKLVTYLTLTVLTICTLISPCTVSHFLPEAFVSFMMSRFCPVPLADIRQFHYRRALARDRRGFKRLWVFLAREERADALERHPARLPSVRDRAEHRCCGALVANCARLEAPAAIGPAGGHTSARVPPPPRPKHGLR